MRYTVDEAARELGVRPAMIYKAMKQGHLPRVPHPNPPTPWTRWVLEAEDLEAYRRQHRNRRSVRPAVLTRPQDDPTG
jgi:predicted site-specific integrase-resolvase